MQFTFANALRVLSFGRMTAGAVLHKCEASVLQLFSNPDSHRISCNATGMDVLSIYKGLDTDEPLLVCSSSASYLRLYFDTAWL